MSKLNEMKKLHDKGLALIYLHEKDKRPIEKGWTSQAKKSWDELESSYENKYNIGVRLGSPSKLISGKYLGAIDCDVKAKSRKAIREMNAALSELGIDLTTAPIVMSGRGNGSKHIYVQTDKPLTSLKYAVSINEVKVHMPGTLTPFSKRDKESLTKEEMENGYRIRPAWEIAFMGEGQQTVLPPSIHPDTNFHYEWASPLTVKYLPKFDPEKFVGKQSSEKLKVNDLDFEALEVDLWATDLPTWAISMIETGEGSNDRSADLLKVSLVMCSYGFTDNQILSVLSDKGNYLGQAAFDHSGDGSRAKAVDWLNRFTLTKARYQTDIMRRFEHKPHLIPLSDKETLKLEAEITEQTNKVLPDLDQYRKPKKTLKNLIHILEVFMGGGLIGQDTFKNRTVFMKDTVYGAEKGNEFSDMNALRFKLHVANQYNFEPPKDLCFEAHELVADKLKFNSLTDYLDPLVWDGIPRINIWLTHAFGAKGNDVYIKMISRKTLIAAIARAYQPGIKVDTMLILEGEQGLGKSQVLKALCGAEWFTDEIGDVSNAKDIPGQLEGKWFVEIAELSAFEKNHPGVLKALFSRATDRSRAAYARKTLDYPRRSVFFGSTNDDEYLNDPTGARRYWPLEVHHIDIPWIEKNRDQLWAEAKAAYQAKEPWWPNAEEKLAAREEQDKRYQADEAESEVASITAEYGDKKFTLSQVWRKLNSLNEDGRAIPSTKDIYRMAKIFKRLKFKKHADKVKLPNGERKSVRTYTIR